MDLGKAFGYFVSGGLAAISISSAGTLLATMFPHLQGGVGTFLGIGLALSLGFALFQPDPEKPVKLWFFGASMILSGVILGGI